ncbi:MAG: hypothetical protein IJ641_00675 [Lachnospiraceae bacterium]|nr:hypothetical protein [Lachnospiraceae bacterium]
MKLDRAPEEKKEKAEPETAEAENKDTSQYDEEKPGTRAYLVLPVVLLSVISAAEIFFLEQSVTGAVRNLIVVAVIAFAAVYACSGWITSRTALIISALGIIASLQAVLPDFVIPVASFGVILALISEMPYLGVSCLVLFSAIPYLSSERSFEYFLFLTVTGMIGIALIYGKKKTGKYAEALIIFTLVYILLYTGLIVMKRMSINPEMIIVPAAGLIMNVVIMEIAGYSYYTNIVKREEELYLSVVDPEHPLLIKLRNNNKREYKRAIHTAHFTELFADKFGYDRVLMKGLGFYHRIGVLREDDDAPLNARTIALAEEEGFPDDIVAALKEYGEARPGQKISAEISITIIVDTVIKSLMDEFSSDNKKPDLNKFIDKEILALFSGKDSLLKKSAIPYNDLEEIRKHLKGERIYYDFLR